MFKCDYSRKVSFHKCQSHSRAHAINEHKIRRILSSRHQKKEEELQTNRRYHTKNMQNTSDLIIPVMQLTRMLCSVESVKITRSYKANL